MNNSILNYFKKNKYGLIFICVVLLGIVPFYINAKIKYNEIQKNGKIGIGKFVEYERKPKTRNYYFEYYNKNKKIRDLIKNPPDGFHKNVGSFYKIKYLDKYENIIVDFDEKITDTVAILKAGFSKEDIANMPK
ncbi:hypothetical protein [Flavobacterium sasangense]|uniref:hypothetical protein n=1 Tax=Flavobacterium sasangense TaxID=503361 RepID=UPI00047D9C89|nr:hypothetical protein [Flavobacterium sasangense]